MRSHFATIAAATLLATVGLNTASPTRADDPPQIGERWAVLIGIDDYAYANDLQYCGADQMALFEQLKSSGFPEDHIFLLHTKSDDERFRPSRTNIERQLDLVLTLAGKRDLVVVGFSGHGVHFDGKSYLCPADAELNNPASLISLDVVYKRLDACDAPFKLVVVDACRNDPRPGGARSFDATEGTRALGRSLTPEELPRGVVLLNSCAAGEISWEEKEFGHGVFMHYVLEGLKGGADQSGDGSVSLNELGDYVGVKTKVYVARKFGYPQKPYFKGEMSIEAMSYALLPVPKAAGATPTLVNTTTPNAPPINTPTIPEVTTPGRTTVPPPPIAPKAASTTASTTTPGPAPAGEITPLGEEAVASLQRVFHSKMEPAVVWRLLPTSYQNDVNDVVRTFARGVDPELWNRAFGVVDKLCRLGRTKKTMVYQSMIIQSAPPDVRPQIDANYDIAFSVLQNLATSELSTHDGLKNADVGRFLQTTGGFVFDSIAQSLESIDTEEMKKFQFVRKNWNAAKVRFVRQTGDTVTLRLETPNQEGGFGTGDEQDFIKVEDKWLPTTVANANWKEEIKTAKERAAELGAMLSNPQMKPQIIAAIDLIDAALDKMQAAPDQATFDNELLGLVGALGSLVPQQPQQAPPGGAAPSQFN